MCICRGSTSRFHYYGSGCCNPGFMGFISVDDEVKLLEEYKRRLQKEIEALEERIEELKSREG
ncbi:MAG: hypothetical protein ACP5K1_01250 [Candidatus Bathyarchaeia archaeon]